MEKVRNKKTGEVYEPDYTYDPIFDDSNPNVIHLKPPYIYIEVDGEEVRIGEFVRARFTEKPMLYEDWEWAYEAQQKTEWEREWERERKRKGIDKSNQV